MRKGRREIGDDGELGLSNAVYRDPPPPPWDEAWRVTEAILEHFRDTVRADGADFFVLSLSNGIQVDPDPALRTRYARAMGLPDLGYPERRLAAHLPARSTYRTRWWRSRWPTKPSSQGDKSPGKAQDREQPTRPSAL